MIFRQSADLMGVWPPLLIPTYILSWTLVREQASLLDLVKGPR